MESNKKLDYDSDVIICEDTPEIIVVPSSPDKKKKAKTKKHKRKVKRAVNYDKNMESLLITQKLPGKKTKFKCVININNINTVCGKRKCDSIVRYEKNVCKKDAYYQRILPICMRNTCFHDEYVLSSSCRSTESRKCKKKVKSGSLSPVSSVALTEIVECNNISYEDVSNGNFSSASDEELETLIKRTKLRENKFSRLYSAPEYTSSSTPVMKFQDNSRISSPFSIDTNRSIHSDTTMVLNPLSSEAYSPTASLDYIKVENFEDLEKSTLKAKGINSIDVPYSPTMTPDLIKADLTSIVNAITCDEDDMPYSPTYSPESKDLKINVITCDEDDMPDSPTYSPESKDLKINVITCDEDDMPYSPTYSPESKDLKINVITCDEDDMPYSPTYSPESKDLKIEYDSIMSDQTPDEDIKPYLLTFSPELIDNEKFDVTLIGVNNTPYSPTVTTGLIKRRKNPNICPSNLIYVKMSDNQTAKVENASHSNVTRSALITSKHIKKGMINDESNNIENNTSVIKRENVQDLTNNNYLPEPDLSATDSKIHIKSERNDDYKCEILVKKEKY